MLKNRVLLIIVVIGIIFIANLGYHYTSSEDLETRKQEIKIYAHTIPQNRNNDGCLEELAFLSERLNDKRIVLLGEQTHSDGSTFALKACIIQYLYTFHNFDVVLYEAGLYDMWKVNQNGTDVLNPRAGIYDFWWNNTECQSIWNFYEQTRKTNKPIYLNGFDIQFTGNISDSIRIQDLDKYLKSKQINLNEFKNLAKIKNQLSRYSLKFIAEKLSKEEKGLILKDLDIICARIKEKIQTHEDEMYYRYVHNMRNRYESIWEYTTGELPRMQLRDSLMADNLIWLADSVYKNKKIIVWTANLHSLYASESTMGSFVPMGKHLKEHFGNSIYSITFTSYGRKEKNGILSNKLCNKSLEFLLYEDKITKAYIDFNEVPQTSFLKKRFVSGINQAMNIDAPWYKMTDLIIYNESVTPPTPIK